MHFISTQRYNPQKKSDDFYYRIKESYRDLTVRRIVDVDADIEFKGIQGDYLYYVSAEDSPAGRQSGCRRRSGVFPSLFQGLRGRGYLLD